MSDATHEQHRAAAKRSIDEIRCAVMTVSDTRTAQTDTSGARIIGLLEDAGFSIAHRAIVPDEPKEIGAMIDTWLGDPSVDVIITTGGTGFARRDRTLEAVLPRLDRIIEGFGELFRMLSHGQVGAAAMLSSAVGGLRCRDDGDVFVFALPGSTAAVDLAVRELIVPEIAHLIGHRR